ncbi:MAG: M20/M25/M40 family metallo-hydrolase [Acidobacteria bacterium]|nr:M20/M25/M40 family metallo-hydrolase [Acidobacteriota bacterium]
MSRVLRVLTLLTAACACAPAALAALTHHSLTVALAPADHRIEVVDRITIGTDVRPDADGAYRFVLHSGLEPRVTTSGWTLEPTKGEPPADFLGLNATTETAGDVPLAGYRLVGQPGAAQPIEIRYGGIIDHPLATSGQEYQRSFSETPGLIDERGVFLAGSSFWVPELGDDLVTFELEVRDLTPPWDVVSQGARTRHEPAADGTRTTAWSCDTPQEEIYLVAGPWHEYSAVAGKVELHAFLREDDAGLADRYLKATKRYLELYQGMLPHYPYQSFSLVENFWETGYGMPGFTLLGPRVIRFPWILTSSYPHELLHNWWGNSAYVDFGSGNWCEGLTAYMADHLFAEQRGEGVAYRRATLKKFSDFVSKGKDFPLAEFHNRFSAASEAVGYGKSLMIFHMIRRAIGDRQFLAALARFYSEHRFTRASFADIAAALSEVSGKDWRGFFSTWISRTGAPQIEIASVRTVKGDGSAPWLVEVALRQAQPEEPFPVDVPVAVTIDGRAEPVWKVAEACGRECTVTIPCPAKPLRMDVDPAFDIMRRLDPLEVPPALSTLFGAGNPLFVLPAAAPADELDAWRHLAADWARPDQPRVALDSDLESLPAGSVWVLGRRNRFSVMVAGRLAAHGVRLGPSELTVAGQTLAMANSSIVLVARGTSPSDAVGLVTAAPVSAIPGLTRKLPHYTRYSYLAFKGSEPQNTAKGLWQPLASPLVKNLSDGPLAELHLPKRVPLAELPPEVDTASLQHAVEVLAAPGFEGRGLGSEGLEQATEWVEGQLAGSGLAAAGDGGFRQSWSWTGGAKPHPMVLTNLLARRPGTDPGLAAHPVLVTAHLDHLGRGWPDVRTGNQGKIHPGADDNASGVAALLELARMAASEPPSPRPLLFAVTTGEEAGLLGARHLLAALDPDKLPFACINLDTVGRLRDGKLYVLDASSAREWRFIWMGVGYTIGTPVSVVSEPLDSSDQGACLERGVPAVQLFTGPNADYHRPSDTPDKIDAPGIATVVEAAHEAIAYLAGRREPLTVTIAGRKTAPAPTAGATRRVSLGTMPDFAFAGTGVRVAQVLPGSAAERAGIRAGDVVTAFDGAPVADLRAYSSALKAHQPGDEVEITVQRDGKQVKLTARLTAR